MRILVACEFSQVVTKAFRERGHEAYSCDILPTEGNSEWHIQDDVLKHLDDGWDMMIAHPPCTYLSYAGVGSWNSKGRLQKRLEALNFFAELWLAHIEKICIENPKGCASPTIAKYSQEIQPHYFGDPHKKTTWLWLKNLPWLIHTPADTLFGEVKTHVDPEVKIQYRKQGKYYSGGEEKKRYATDFTGSKTGHDRSRTYPGIANAMAEQWGR